MGVMYAVGQDYVVAKQTVVVEDGGPKLCAQAPHLLDRAARQFFHRPGAGAKARVVPEGDEGAERIAYWSNLGTQHFARLGASVEALPVIEMTLRRK